MDHVDRILPTARALGPIDIPLLASKPYDGGEYLTYPLRHGLGSSRGLKESATRGEDPFLGLTSSENLGEVLQTWMYFGLLELFLNKPVAITSFERIDDTGQRLLSSASLEGLVQSRVLDVIAARRALGRYTNSGWSQSFKKALQETCRVVTTIAKDEPGPETAISRVCLGIAFLSEYLGCALSGLFISLGVEDPFNTVSTSWRENVAADIDHGRLIVLKMLEKGWCPNALPMNRFAGISEVTTLWFVANLPRPMPNVSHDRCSEDACLPMQIKEEDYMQVHMDACGGCKPCGPIFADLAAIINAGRLPLVTVKENTTSKEIEILTEEFSGQKFVAISHVWSDGRGSPESNTLPMCVLRHLQELVNSSWERPGTESISFWMDTLCLPCPSGDAEKQKLRKRALQQLKMPYLHATTVVVVDSYLLNHPVSDPQAFVFMAQIACSGWFRRLWTYQESRLANRISFAFGDRLQNLEHEVDLRALRNMFAKSHIPPFFFNFIRLITLIQSSIRYLIRPPGYDERDFDESMSVKSIRAALLSRTTSKAEDEALCISSVLGLPDDAIRDIVYCRPGDRMRILWSRLPEVPSDLAFSRASEKLGDAGFRWAPKSFLGMRDLNVPRWLGRHRMDAPSATVVSGGLAVRRPAWFVRVRDATQGAIPALRRHVRQMIITESGINLGIQLHVPDAHGKWFTCVVRQPWHLLQSDLEGLDQLAILVNSPMSFSQHLQSDDKYAIGEKANGLHPGVAFEGFDSLGQGSIMHLSVDLTADSSTDKADSSSSNEGQVVPGLLVACRADSTDDGAIQTAAIFHVDIAPVARAQADVMEYAAGCAARIRADFGVLNIVGMSPQERAERIQQEVRRSVSEAPLGKEVFREFLALQLSLDLEDVEETPPEEVLERTLFGYVHTFLLTGTPVLEPARDSITWVVD